MAEDPGKLETNHPVDKGWAWFVLFGCVCNFVVYLGTLRSFGIFFVEFLGLFGSSVSKTSMIAGLMQGTYSFFSLPIMAIGLHHLSPRQFVLIGGCIGSLSYALGSVAPNVNFLLFTQGILYGMGFACVHGPSTYILGQYFEKRRSLANAFMVAGGSTGGLILPPVYRYLMDMYGVRGALLITSGILFHTAVGSMLLRPTSFYNKIKFSNLANTTKDCEEKENVESLEIHSFDNSTTDVNHSQLLNSIHTIASCNGDKQHQTQKIISTPCTNSIKPDSLSFISRKKDRSQTSECYCNNEDTERHSLTSKGNGTNGYLRDGGGRHYHSSYSVLGSRVDVYTDSITDLSQKQADEDQTRISCDKGEKTRGKRSCLSLCNIDLSLLRNPSMLLFLFTYYFGSIGSAYGGIYIPAFARDAGMTSSRIALIVSTISGCDVVGRLMCGAIVDRQFMSSANVVSITCLLTGLFMQLTYFFNEFWSLMLFSVLHGLFAGGIFALFPAVLVDFLGIDNLRNALGISIFTQGFALASAAPLIGYLRDRTLTYTSSFQFMGACMLLAGLVLLFKPFIIRRLCNANKKDKYSEQTS